MDFSTGQRKRFRIRSSMSADKAPPHPTLTKKLKNRRHPTPNIYKVYTSVRDEYRKIPRNPVLILFLTAHLKTSWLLNIGLIYMHLYIGLIK